MATMNRQNIQMDGNRCLTKQKLIGNKYSDLFQLQSNDSDELQIQIEGLFGHL